MKDDDKVVAYHELNRVGTVIKMEPNNQVIVDWGNNDIRRVNAADLLSEHEGNKLLGLQSKVVDKVAALLAEAAASLDEIHDQLQRSHMDRLNDLMSPIYDAVNRRGWSASNLDC